MRIVVRMLRGFHAKLVADLQRPHPVAWERVGWVFAKQAAAGPDQLLLFPVDYEPVADDDYVPDDTVGAKFNTTTIRSALQRSRSTGLSCLQVHLHDHVGDTDFSSVDRRTIDELAPSLLRMAPDAAHGGLVLSRDSATSRIWPPSSKGPARSHVVIIGFPIRFGAET